MKRLLLSIARVSFSESLMRNRLPIFLQWEVPNASGLRAGLSDWHENWSLWSSAHYLFGNFEIFFALVSSQVPPFDWSVLDVWYNNSHLYQPSCQNSWEIPGFKAQKPTVLKQLHYRKFSSFWGFKIFFCIWTYQYYIQLWIPRKSNKALYTFSAFFFSEING